MEVKLVPISASLVDENDDVKSTHTDIESQSQYAEKTQEVVVSDVDGNRSSICCKACKIFAYTIPIVPMFVLHLLLVITFFFQTGSLRGTGGWHLNAFLSSTIVLLFALSLCYAHLLVKNKKIQNKKRFRIVFIMWGILLIILNEIALGIVVPTASVFPLEMFDNHDAFKTSADLTEACT